MTNNSNNSFFFLKQEEYIHSRSYYFCWILPILILKMDNSLTTSKLDKKIRWEDPFGVNVPILFNCLIHAMYLFEMF